MQTFLQINALAVKRHEIYRLICKLYENLLDPPVQKDEALEKMVTWGEQNQVQMQFNANPKPSNGYWTINGTKVYIGSSGRGRKYSSSPLFGTEVIIFGRASLVYGAF